MSTPPKMRPTKGAPKGRRHVRLAQEKRDDDIMNTNDSSIVSKRSVSKLYFPEEPDFYQPFVQKYARRNPLINRGYWLRMHAVEHVVRRFLDENSEKPKVVVNLGCGYDPLPFQFWHRYASSCQNATFVDVDYPQLIEKKIDRMLNDNQLRDALLKTGLQSSEKPVYLRSAKYMALGCDLRDLDTLKRILNTEFGSSAHSILFVAEVSITYMPLRDSDALIQWSSKFKDASFCLLEQFLPQGPNHPFAQTMLKHFNKLQTPIQAVKQYPSLQQQQNRFANAGWLNIEIARNLWDLWCDQSFTPPRLRRSLDSVEPFDEWEEFALFAGHYFLILASNSEETNRGNAMVDAQPGDLGAPDEESERIAAQVIVLHSHEPSVTSGLTPRRFGAAFTLGHGTLAVHGGQDPQHRSTSIDILHRNGSRVRIQPDPTPQARICHTITTMKGDKALLVGGRKSPTQALTDCWLLEDGMWREVQELSPGRFRHSAVGVTVPCRDSTIEGVLVLGGKTSDGCLVDTCSIWTPKQGWQLVPVVGTHPSARFGAAISSMGAASSSGLYVGGMGSDGTALDEVWEYNISATPDLQVRFRHCDNGRHGNPSCARFGASLVPLGDSLLLIGGITSKEIGALSDDFMLISTGDGLRVKKHLVSNRNDTWPLLVGVGTAVVSDDELVITGGGAVCFSMGSYWNQGYVSITRDENAELEQWSVTDVESTNIPAHARQSQRSKLLPKGSNKAKPKSRGVTSRNESVVPRIQLRSAEDFSKLLKASKPTIIEHLDLGPCTRVWTLDYLKEKLGTDREIVIHECSSDRMTFKDKNFEYIKTTVGSFFEGISQDSKTYLRAVSTSQSNKLPTKLEDDFPAIAPDFQLPEELSLVKETYHSSPLRISGPVSLWLHYDVLANILCQIRGTKTLRLYPPSDVKYLDFPPGGSSSNTNVLTVNPSDPKLRHTHPHTASLKPGDVLFIPPMWSHTATPEEGYSVAVNVFFRNLEKGYAAGKDVYGNRDLQGYETGRRDIDKIVRAFRDIPGDISKFYLERLAMELQDKADAVGRAASSGNNSLS